MKKFIKIQSVSDIITNSSSEAFMLDSTKLSKEDLEYFKNAMNNTEDGYVGYVNDYLKNDPYDLIEFTDIVGISMNEVIDFEREMRDNDETWDVENINKFLAKYDMSLEDFSKYILVYDNKDRYSSRPAVMDVCDELSGAFDLQDSNDKAVVEHSYCF